MPQPTPTIIVANEVAGDMVERDIGLHRVQKMPGSLVVCRTAGEPPLLLGKDTAQTDGVQEGSAEATALASITIDGSGAVGIACFSQRGIWVRGVVPGALFGEDNPQPPFPEAQGEC